MKNLYENVLDNMPKEGFIKLSSSRPSTLSGADKAALIRKGNTFFNSGEIEKAERIFITTGYTDGLIRMGDIHLKNDEPLKALRMYWLAPAPDKIETWMQKASKTISKWLAE
ncbi:MAG: hypothetical protein PQJ46_12725 [Spirochaetales bacterium]|nr:hypothetical protein [Spirochaetales bacterium]